MGTIRRAELRAVFDCDPREGGLNEFEPEPEAEGGGVDALRWRPHIAPPKTRSWPFVVPVIAAAIAGAAVSWLGQRARGIPGVPAPVVSELVVQAAPLPAAAAAPAPPAPAALAPGAPAPVNPAVEATLAAVSRSYRDLDPASLAMVWPGADTASLEQSFATLKYQSLSFERCETRPNGPEGVLASCDVSIAAAPKSGDPALERRRESWTLVLARSGDRWTIGGVSVR